MVATSVLGTGVDFPSVVWTLHVDILWSMINYTQESGRAGRGREVVDSVILAPEHAAEGTIYRGEVSDDTSTMAHFIATRECRRRIMSEYLDGPELARSYNDLEHSTRCDRCGEGAIELAEKRRRAVR